MSKTSLPSTREPSPPRRSRPRRVLRWSLLSLLALILVVGLAIAWVTQTGHGRKFLLAQISDILSESVFTGTVKARRIDGPIFGEFILRDVTLTDDEEREAAFIEEAYVRYTFTQLLRRRLIITRLDIDGVSVSGRIREDGSLNLTKLFVPGDPDKVPPEQGFAVAIQRLTLAGTTIQIMDERVNELVIAFRDPHMVADFDMDGRGQMHAGISELASSISFGLALGREFSARIDDLSVDLDPKEIFFAAERLSIGETGLFGFDGKILRTTEIGTPFEHFEARMPQLVFSPEEMMAFVPSLPLATTLTIDATIEGPPEDVVLRAGLSGADQGATAEVKLDLSNEEDIGLRGTLLVEAFKPELWLALPGVTGDVNAEILFSVQGLTPQRLRAGLEVNITPSTLLGYKLDSGLMRLGFAQNVATLDALSFQAGTAALRGSGSVALSGDVDLHVELDAPNLADLATSAPNAPDLQGRLFAEVRAKGEVPFEELNGDALKSVDGIIEHVVRHLDILATVDASRVRVDTLMVGDADIQLQGARGDRLSLDLEGVMEDLVSGSTTVDFANVSAAVDGDQLRLQGSARAMDTDLALRADGSWSMRQLRLRIQELAVAHESVEGQLQSPARLEVDLSETGALTQVRLDAFDFKGPGTVLRIDEARYNSNGSISGLVTAEVSEIEELLNIVGQEDLRASGAVWLDGRVEGTLSRPRYDINLRTEAVRALDIGPVSGALSLAQLSSHMTVHGLLCLGDEPADSPKPPVDCEGRQTLLDARDLVLPILPGFSSVGVRFDEKGVLGGYAEIGPLDIRKVAAEVEAAAAYRPRGDVGLQLFLDGTFLQPNVAAILTLEDFWVDIPMGEGKPAVEFGPVRTVMNLKVEDEGDTFSVARWGLGGNGLQVDGKTWLRAHGDVRAPARAFLLGELSFAELAQQTWGVPISLEVPNRPLSDLPAGLLPKELDPDGSVYMSLDMTRTEEFTGAKFWFNATDIVWDDVGPLQFFVSAVSSNDTSVVVNVESLETEVRATLDATLMVSLLDLIRRGVQPEDRIAARLHIPSMALAELPSGAVRAQVEEILNAGRELSSPKLTGYVDVFHTLGDAHATGRFQLNEIKTATGSITEAGFEFIFAPSSLMGFSGGDLPRLQAMLTVCGPDDSCALQLHAAAVLGVQSGAFLFSDERTRNRAMEKIRTTPYAATLRAEDAPLAALAPSWLLTDLATNLDGILNADLRVEGTLDHVPEVKGFLDIKNGRGEIIPLARRLDDFDLRLLASPQTIRLEHFSLSDGVGSIQGVGEIALTHGLPSKATLQFDFERFLLADASGVGVFLTAGVPVEAGIRREGMDVEVRLDDAEVYVPDSATAGATGGPTTLPENVLFLGEGQTLKQYVDETERRAVEEKAAGRLQNVSIPIHVHVYSREDVRVRQRFADLRLGVDMNLRLKDGEILTSGGVTVSEGYAQVFGKRFDVTLGRVLFDGGGDGPFDPRLRVTAVHRLPRKTASLLAPPSGQFAAVSVVMDTYVSTLDIQLRSDPPMSESDVLNVLLTGKPIETSGEARPEALTTAGTLLAGFLTDQLGTNPVIDNLSVELDDSEGGLDSRFEGGRYFGKDNSIYASVAYIAGADANENSVEVAWQFILAQLRSSSLRLELRWGNRRTGAAEFLYDLRLDKGLRFVR